MMTVLHLELRLRLSGAMPFLLRNERETIPVEVQIFEQIIN
jgi:hypothetical protein